MTQNYRLHSAIKVKGSPGDAIVSAPASIAGQSIFPLTISGLFTGKGNDGQAVVISIHVHLLPSNQKRLLKINYKLHEINTITEQSTFRHNIKSQIISLTVSAHLVK